MVGGGVVARAGTGRPPHASRLSLGWPCWWGAAWSCWRDEAAAARVTPVSGEALMVGGGVVELLAGAGRPPHASGLSLGGP